MRRISKKRGRSEVVQTDDVKLLYEMARAIRGRDHLEVQLLVEKLDLLPPRLATSRAVTEEADPPSAASTRVMSEASITPDRRRSSVNPEAVNAVLHQMMGIHMMDEEKQKKVEVYKERLEDLASRLELRTTAETYMRSGESIVNPSAFLTRDMRGVDDSRQGDDEEPLLNYAIRTGSSKAAIALIEAGAMFEYSGTFFKRNALMEAVRARDDKVIEALLEAGAEVTDDVDHRGRTALHFACRKSTNADDGIGFKLPILKLLVPKCSKELLDMSITTTDKPIDKLKIKKYEVDGSVGFQTSIDSQGPTALHLLCWQGLSDAVDCLIQAGADVNSKDSLGETPILMCLYKGRRTHMSCFEKLYATGEVNWCHITGNFQNILHCLARIGNDQLFTRITHEDYDIRNLFAPLFDQPDANGNTPFLLACESGNNVIARNLFERGVDYLRTNHDGCNIFHMLAKGRGASELRKNLASFMYFQACVPPSASTGAAMAKAARSLGYAKVPQSQSAVEESSNGPSAEPVSIKEEEPEPAASPRKSDGEAPANEETEETPAEPDESVGDNGPVEAEAQAGPGDDQEEPQDDGPKEDGEAGQEAGATGDDADDAGGASDEAAEAAPDNTEKDEEGGAGVPVAPEPVEEAREEAPPVDPPTVESLPEPVQVAESRFDPDLFNLKDKANMTPLAYACKRNHVALSDFFFEKNRDEFMAQDKANSGWSCVHICARNGSLETLTNMQTVIEENIDAIRPDSNGRTPLALAVAAWSVPCAKFFSQLLPNDVFVGDNDGLTPLVLSVTLGEMDLLKMILDLCDSLQHPEHYDHKLDVGNAFLRAISWGYGDLALEIYKRRMDMVEISAEIVFMAIERALLGLLKEIVKPERNESGEEVPIQLNLEKDDVFKVMGNDRCRTAVVRGSRRLKLSVVVDSVSREIGHRRFDNISANGITMYTNDESCPDQDAIVRDIVPWTKDAKCIRFFRLFLVVRKSGIGFSGDEAKKYDECIQILYKLWMSQDGSFHVADENGDTILHMATKLFHHHLLSDIVNSIPAEDLAQILEVKNNRGQTPLLLACSLFEEGESYSEDQQECIKVLVEAGASSSVAIPDTGEIPLLLSLRAECAPIALFLMEKAKRQSYEIHFADAKGRTSIMLAAGAGIHEFLAAAIEITTITDKGLPPLERGVNKRDEKGHSALYRACMTRNSQCISILLKGGATPLLDKEQGTLMHKVIQDMEHSGENQFDLEVLESLVQHSSLEDRRYVREDGLDAYLLAIKTKAYRAQAVLLRSQTVTYPWMRGMVGLNEPNTIPEEYERETLRKLKKEEARNHPKIIFNVLDDHLATTMMMEFRPYLDVKNEDNDSPFHVAVKSGNNDVLESILEPIKTGVMFDLRATLDEEDAEGVSTFSRAVMMHDATAVTLILESKAEIDLTRVVEEGRTALHTAVHHKDIQIVDEILAYIKGEEIEYDFNLVDDSGSSVLHTAIERGMSTVVSQIIQQHPDTLFTLNGEGLNALELSLTHDERCAVSILEEALRIENNMPVPIAAPEPLQRPGKLLSLVQEESDNDILPSNGSELIEHLDTVAEGDKNDALEIIQDEGAIVEEEEEAPQSQEDESGGSQGTGSSDESSATEEEEEDPAGIAGFNVNKPDHEGYTPLARAMKNSFPEVISLLVQFKDIDVNVKDPVLDERVLHASLINNADDPSATIALLAAMNPDLDVTSRDKDGRTPIGRCILTNQASVVEYLLQYDSVDVNVPNPKGQTPLQAGITMHQENAAAAERLLEQCLERDLKVDVLVKDDDGMMPIHISMKNSQLEIFRLLLHFPSTDVNAPFPDDDQTPLQYAFSMDTPDFAHALLELSFKNNLPLKVDTFDGDLPFIHLCVIKKWPDVVRCLLEFDINVNDDSSGDPPLILGLECADSNDPESLAPLEVLLQICIEKRLSLDVSVPDKNGLSPLMHAVEKNLTRVSELLCKFGNTTADGTLNGMSMMHLAVMAKNSDLVRSLFDLKTTDPNVLDEETKLTPLLMAMRSNDAETATAVVKAALERNVSLDVNVRDENDNTALGLAFESGEHELVGLLCSTAGVTLDNVNRFNQTALEAGVGYEDRRISERMCVSLLEAAKYRKLALEVNTVDAKEKTPLMIAVERGQQQVVSMLLDYPLVDVNAVDVDGNTPLHLAVMSNNAHSLVSLIVKKVLSNKLRLKANMKNTEGYTALHVAIRNSEADVVLAIMETGLVDLDSTSPEGYTALIHALKVDKRSSELVQTILHHSKKLELDLNVNALDPETGVSAIFMIAERHWTKHLDLLQMFQNIDLNIQRTTTRQTVVMEALQACEDKYSDGIAESMLQHALKCRVEVDVNIEDKSGNTALVYAVDKWNVEVAKLLCSFPSIDLDSDASRIALYKAATHESMDQTMSCNIIKSAAQHGGSFNVNHKFKDGYNLLGIAIDNNHQETMQVILNIKDVLVEDVEPNGRSAFYQALAKSQYSRGPLLILLRMCHQNSIPFNVNEVDPETGNTPLHFVVLNNYVDALKNMLEIPDVDYNIINGHGRTVLHEAVCNNIKEPEIINLLLTSNKNMDVNIKDSRGTALFHAVYRNDVDTISLLLQVPTIDLNDVNYSGQNAAQAALSEGCRTACLITILRKALDNRLPLDVNATSGDEGTMLHQSVRASLHDAVHLLLQFPRIDINIVDSKGLTALHYALLASDLVATRLVLDGFGLNLGVKDVRKRTPLHIAVWESSKPAELVRNLIDKGKKQKVKTLDFNARDAEGNMPLHYAIKRRDIECIEILIQNKKSMVNNINAQSQTALDVATSLWQDPIAREDPDKNLATVLAVLRVSHDNSRPLEVNTQSDPSTGNTSLHVAIVEKQLEWVNALLDFATLNLNALDNDGRTPIVVALINITDDTSYEIAKAVVACKWPRDINIKDKDGNALYHAIRLNHKDLVRLLLDCKGIDLNDIDHEGRSAPQVAIAQNSIESLSKVLQRALELNLPMDVNSQHDGSALLHVVIKDKLHDSLVFLLKFPEIDVNAVDESGFAPIHIALMNGDMFAVEILVSNYRINLGVQDKSGRNALHHAVLSDIPDVAVERLCAQDSVSLRPNARDVDGCIPLYYAIANRLKNVIPILINRTTTDLDSVDGGWNSALEIATRLWTEDQGTDVLFSLLKATLHSKKKMNVNTVNKQTNMTPLHYTVERNQLDITKLLLEFDTLQLNAQNNDKQTATHMAITRGGTHLNIAKAIIASKKPQNINLKDNKGTALYHAILADDIEIIALLLEKRKIDVNHIDHEGNSAPQVALRHTSLEALALIISMVLSNNISLDVNVLYKEGTILHQSVRRGLYDAIKFLLEFPSIDANMVDDMNSAPIHIATQNGDVTALELLLQFRNINLGMQDSFLRTPLHVCINSATNRLQCLELLISAEKRSNMKLNINAKDSEGKTALHYALQSEQDELIELLIKNEEADVNLVNSLGHTALEFAVFHWIHSNNSNIVVTVLEGCRQTMKDLNVNTCEDETGKTPLHFAVEQNDLQIVSYLMNFSTIDLNAKDKDGYTAVFRAMSEHGDDQRCANLILLKARNLKIPFDIQDALLLAVQKNRVDLVQTLLFIGDIDTQDSKRIEEILKHACHMEDGLAFDLLVTKLVMQEHEVDFQTEVTSGRLYVLYAAHMNYPQALRNIFGAHTTDECKFLANSMGSGGVTVLQTALMRNSPQCLDILIAHGADFLNADDTGSTSLHTAIMVSNPIETCNVLLRQAMKKGQDTHDLLLNRANNDGTTALLKAAELGNLNLVKVLVEAGAKTNAADIQGHTPLHVVAKPPHHADDIEICRVLIEKECDPYRRDEMNMTAVHYASDEIQAYLIQIMLAPRLPATIHIHYCNNCELLHPWHSWHDSNEYLWHLYKTSDIIQRYFKGVAIVPRPLVDYNTRERTDDMPFGVFEIKWHDATGARNTIYSKMKTKRFPSLNKIITMIVNNLCKLKEYPVELLDDPPAPYIPVKQSDLTFNPYSAVTYMREETSEYFFDVMKRKAVELEQSEQPSHVGIISSPSVQASNTPLRATETSTRAPSPPFLVGKRLRTGMVATPVAAFKENSKDGVNDVDTYLDAKAKKQAAGKKKRRSSPRRGKATPSSPKRRPASTGPTDILPAGKLHISSATLDLSTI